jgi:L-alanine-DL-glutamate epimerase-like enolase superfamily enzyme
MAEAAGITMQVGAMLESRLGMTAFAHFALSNAAIQHYDFDTALMFSSDPVTGGIVYSEGGVISVPDVAGLGATIDEGLLKDMESVLVL